VFLVLTTVAFATRLVCVADYAIVVAIFKQPEWMCTVEERYKDREVLRYSCACDQPLVYDRPHLSPLPGVCVKKGGGVGGGPERRQQMTEFSTWSFQVASRSGILRLVHSSTDTSLCCAGARRVSQLRDLGEPGVQG
jgi:hypothetical protein